MEVEAFWLKSIIKRKIMGLVRKLSKAAPVFATLGTLVTTVSADETRLTDDQVTKTLDQVFTEVTSDVLKSQATDTQGLLLETATSIVEKIDKLDVSDADKEVLKTKAQEFISNVAVKAAETPDNTTRCGCPQHQLLYALVDKLESFETKPVAQESKLETPKAEETSVPQKPAPEAPVQPEAPLEEAKTDVKEPKEVQDVVDKVTDVKDVEPVKSDQITSEAGRGQIESKAQETKTSKKVYIKKSEYKGDQKGTGVVYYDDPSAIDGEYVTITEDEAKTKGYSPSLRRTRPTAQPPVASQEQAKTPEVATATTQPTVPPTQPQSPRKADNAPQAQATTQSQAQLPATGQKDSSVLTLVGLLGLIPLTLALKKRKAE
jgi:LPXTG-motif cell wall anchor domain protein